MIKKILKYLNEGKVPKEIENAYNEGWDDAVSEFMDELSDDVLPPYFVRSLKNMKKNNFYEYSRRMK